MEETYEVERILNHKGPRSKRQYLVRWKGCKQSEDSWVPARDFSDRGYIEEYEERVASSSRAGTRKKRKSDQISG